MNDVKQNKAAQLVLGTAFGFVFGFLLQRGGVTEYDILIGQLLLTDFTVLKVMLSAVAVGMAGVNLLAHLGLVELQIKRGSWGASLIGGLIFGVGFGLLGYCPGTVSGAAAKGYIDALLAGIPGLLVGAAIFAWAFPRLTEVILNKGDFGKLTFDQLLKLNRWVTIAIFEAMIITVLVLLEIYT
ncbi:MAG: YeeE/YedE family protein [Phycisphaerae bacterium]|nr:YeeE/YedE family protein [Phycisphaerae bacterium]